MPDGTIYRYIDKSKLYHAWEKYYNNMGLAYNKLNHKVYQRVQKGKFPTIR
jgi:archaellum component FlaF (FlaF/FlaG flagellin family)